LLAVIGNTAGYLGLFIFGLHFMSRQLSGAAGPAVKLLFLRVAGRPWSACLFGCLVTAVVQSSSLTSVMVVGLVNAKMISLTQAIAVIIGANVGTTMTAQLLSFNLQRLALPLIGVSVLLYFLPIQKLKSVAGASVGFAFLLLGLDGMVQSLSPLQGSQFMDRLLAAGQSPWQGLGGGLAASVFLQSSSAVMGLVLSLAMREMISLPTAVAVLIGADLGTSSTALAASLGMGRLARSAAWSHFLFNLLSLVLALIFFPGLIRLAAATSELLPRQLANIHTLYNLMGALIFLPLTPLLADLFQGGSRGMNKQ